MRNNFYSRRLAGFAPLLFRDSSLDSLPMRRSAPSRFALFSERIVVPHVMSAYVFLCLPVALSHAQGPQGRFMSLEAIAGDCTWSESAAPRSVATQSIYYDAVSGRIESLLPEAPDAIAKATPELAPRPLRGLSCRLSGGRASCWPDPDTDSTILAVSRASGASQIVNPLQSIVFRLRALASQFELPCERKGPQGFHTYLFRPPRN